MKILSGKVKKDKWDQVIDATIKSKHHEQQFEDFEVIQHNHHEHYDRFSDKFEYFDSTTNNEREIVMRKPRNRENDMLAQIYDREFGPKTEESMRLIQKPPRKSIEMRKSWDQQSHNSNFDKF